MSDVTVEQLAKSIGIPVPMLLEQLSEARIQAAQPQDRLSEPQKESLLSYLKTKQSGVTPPATLGLKKITLNRKSVSEIKIQTLGGKKSTVSVVSKKRHTYVKKEEGSKETAELELSEKGGMAGEAAPAHVSGSSARPPEPMSATRQTAVQEAAAARRVEQPDAAGTAPKVKGTAAGAATKYSRDDRERNDKEKEKEREKRGKSRGKVSPLARGQKAENFPKNLENIQDWKQAVVDVSAGDGLDDETVDSAVTADSESRLRRRVKRGKEKADQKQHLF